MSTLELHSVEEEKKIFRLGVDHDLKVVLRFQITVIKIVPYLF